MHKIITVQLKKKKVENRVPYGYSDVADGGPIGIPEPTSVVLIYAKILKQHNNNHRISLVFKCRSVECGGRGCENVIAALSYFRCVPKIEICRFRINISTVTVSLPPPIRSDFNNPTHIESIFDLLGGAGGAQYE